jgi:hypothetical protein
VQLSNDTVIDGEIVATATTVGRRSTWLERSYRERKKYPWQNFQYFLELLAASALINEYKSNIFNELSLAEREGFGLSGIL